MNLKSFHGQVLRISLDIEYEIEHFRNPLKLAHNIPDKSYNVSVQHQYTRHQNNNGHRHIDPQLPPQ